MSTVEAAPPPALPQVSSDVSDRKLNRRFFHSYLVAFTYFTSIAVGALFVVLVFNLLGAKWAVTVRRTAEILTQAFPILFLLSIGVWGPMLLGNDNLFVWSSKEFMHNDHLVHAKSGYLNAPFFAARCLLYFAIWIGISRFFFKQSTAQDEDGDEARTAKMIWWSAPLTMVYAFTVAFFAFDMLMSLDPQWFSTMFGVYYFAGCGIAIFSMMILVLMGLQRSGRIMTAVTVEHYHDLGKLLFAFVFFWAYVAFSQFMLIWGANIPEETFYFYKRWFSFSEIGAMGPWAYVTLALLAFHFVVPFVLLMSRHSKRRLQVLAVFCLWMLGWHYVDLYWQVMPALNNHAEAGLAAYNSVKKGAHIDIAAWVGMGLLFMGAVAGAMAKVNLVPNKDPNLSDALRFENV